MIVKLKNLFFLFLLLFYLSACTSTAFALSGDCTAFFSRVGFGWSQPDTNNNVTQKVSPGPGWPADSYISKTNTNTVNQLSLAAGMSVLGGPCSGLPFWSLLLEFTRASDVTINGVIQQYSLPKFQNYTYRYQIQRNTVMLELKFDFFEVYNHFMPYIIGGVGYSATQGKSYEEKPYPHVTPRISPAFTSKTNNQQSYMFGAGIDYLITPSFWLGLEFNYSHLGTVKTGNGQAYPTLTGFNYSDVYLQTRLNTKQVILYLTYYPDFS